MTSRLLAAVAATVLVGGAPASAAGTSAVVFEDASGDAGNQDTGLPGGSEAGFDLVEGFIAKKGKRLEFTVSHAAMPPGGTLPEGFRFLWHFRVGKKEYRFTAKSGDIGKPDALAQSGTERIGRVDLDGHFRLEQCRDEPLPAVLTLVNCRPVEYLDGSFEPAVASFTIVLPRRVVKAKTGTVIAAGTAGAAGSGCQICWVPHYAERSLTPSTIVDSAAMSETYRVPRK